MNLTRDRAALLDELLAETDNVLETATLLTRLTAGELRWRLTSGRWQQPFKGAIVAHNGPLTDQQMLRLALLRTGPGAVRGAAGRSQRIRRQGASCAKSGPRDQSLTSQAS
jgi:hypothetical protein